MRGARLVMLEARLLTKSEAARYCSRSPAQFERDCPVAPIAFGNGDKRYDVRKLDAWIDGLQPGMAYESDDEIVARLGK